MLDTAWTFAGGGRAFSVDLFTFSAFGPENIGNECHRLTPAFSGVPFQIRSGIVVLSS